MDLRNNWIRVVSLYALLSVVTAVSFVGQPLFNAMTPYFWVKNVNERIMNNEFAYTTYKNDTCEIIGLNYLYRHAARFPSLQWIKKMESVHSILAKDSAVVTKNVFIATWASQFPQIKEYQQSEVGDTEMEELGKRFYKRFKKLVDVYKDNVSFLTTSKRRTVTSYLSFINGWLAENVTLKQLSYGSNNEILRYYDYCDKYKIQVENNKQTHTEVNKFLNGDEMTIVTDNVKEKLGFADITAEDVVTIHQICAFELGMFNSSDWCSLFNKEDLEVIDYLIDMRNYWEMGYAYDINWRMSCRFTELRLFDLFDKVIGAEDNGPASRNFHTMNINFAHTDTILPLYAAFGLFNDSHPFLANNYNANRNRKFRTSLIGPFSANLGFGLYKCNMKDKHVIKMFVNEEPVDIPECGNSSEPCLYQDFVARYNRLVDCDFEKLCSVKPSSSVSLLSNMVFFLIAAVLTSIHVLML